MPSLREKMPSTSQRGTETECNREALSHQPCKNKGKMCTEGRYTNSLLHTDPRVHYCLGWRKVEGWAEQSLFLITLRAEGAALARVILI